MKKIINFKTIAICIFLLVGGKYLAHNIYIEREKRLEGFCTVEDGYHNLLYLFSHSLCEMFEDTYFYNTKENEIKIYESYNESLKEERLKLDSSLSEQRVRINSLRKSNIH